MVPMRVQPTSITPRAASSERTPAAAFTCTRGPTDARISCMSSMVRASVGPRVQVKAAAGVRTLDAALGVIDVGCTRIGTIATAIILDEFGRRLREKASPT